MLKAVAQLAMLALIGLISACGEPRESCCADLFAAFL